MNRNTGGHEKLNVTLSVRMTIESYRRTLRVSPGRVVLLMTTRTTSRRKEYGIRVLLEGR